MIAPTLRQLRRIVTAAMRAPSVDNCQPWRFHWDGALSILLDAERARHSMDLGWHGSDISLGCVLESLQVAAAAEGLGVEETLHLDTPAEPRWATVRFHAGGTGDDSLLRALERRAVDRRPYRGGSAKHPVFDRVRAEVARFPACDVHVIGRFPQELMNFCACGDAFFWRTESVYLDTMRWLRMTQREVEETRDGAAWRALGVDLPELKMMQAMRAPLARRVLCRLGVPAAAGVWTRRQIASSAALLLFTVRAPRRESLVAVGHAALAAWFRLTEADYAVQPHSFWSMLLLKAATGTLPSDTDPAYGPLLAEGREIVARAFGLDRDELPVWLLRTGISSFLPEHCRTLRRPLDELFTVAPGR